MITKEYKGERLHWYRFLKVKFQAIINNNIEIKYCTADGQILRIDLNKDTKETPEILNNLEQIKYLQWFGEYGQNLKKVGKWTATWKGQILKNVGGIYSEDGKKIGSWIELKNNYMESAQVYEIGDYFDNQRIGNWKYLFKDYEIGGGHYNEQSLKNGNWTELSQDFHVYKQIIYNGKYRDGKKIDMWTEYLREDGFIQFEEIGGGYYDNIGKELKIGNWIELIDFQKNKKITFNGEYKDGYKIGRWNILNSEYSNNEIKIIGGGYYDEQKKGLKFGKWIELDDNSTCDIKITSLGEYKNGQKVGIWDFYRNSNIKQELLGGGLYEIEKEKGCVKNGKWIELSDNFENFRQIIYCGVYNYGKKIGRWDVFWRESDKNDFEKIGGGSYNQIEFGMKEGKWKELSEIFSNSSQIIYDGQYKSNKKIGRWNIYFRRTKEKFEQIGGGDYNSENGMKQGQWIDLFHNFREDSQVTYNGEYKNGQKIGKWDIYYKESLGDNFEWIGAGSYDLQERGIKQGKWVELSDTFQDWGLIIFQGEYHNGRKIGKWEEKKRDFCAFSKRFFKTREIFYQN
ncbi:unnamed protein product [Paramecium sonneborni]|uniref:Uncharacterized protein n=1 Tax=Paramecium sonneborni TaxID=65129 RepID=A0A8S1RIC3_9CILI|nr:unnamed protein product [Paramecium sonneborni]